MEPKTSRKLGGEWSISSEASLSEPLLTSSQCYDALVQFFQNESSLLLEVVTESSSHVSGLGSLYAQPWVYAGGGLGNMDECPLQVCLAGGTKRDSLTFASVCMVPGCSAKDLAARDFVGRLEAASFRAEDSADHDIIKDYVTLHERIAQVNQFLSTGWVCGEYKVPWKPLLSLLFVLPFFGCLILGCIGTFLRPKRDRQTGRQNIQSQSQGDCEEKKDSLEYEKIPFIQKHNRKQEPTSYFWSAWSMSGHVQRLFQQRTETASLDGLKVGSILWVISGHVMAIQSSSGPGYLNPSSFLPPSGITTKFFGQLLFSSRFAVDTFLCISGFLVVHVLKKKLRPTFLSVIQTLLFRIIRIIPLYAFSLGFWILIAPHLGSGPFWYQWEYLLEPCYQNWWTNALFLNNFLPWGQPTAETCFYHSWYLAVDIQLFFLLAPWIVLLYQRSEEYARRATIFLWSLSVFVTAILTWRQKWSINTFDGTAVVLFDVEGYAKPHVRAQSYLAGMFVAMLPRSPRHRPQRDISLLVLVLGLLSLLSFVTVTGAYSRRACNFGEWPSLDDCGSTWRPEYTFIYTAFSRAIWSISLAILIRLCTQQRGFLVGAILSWNLWTPLAHLSFGSYLIHPIIIFIWQLGGKEKTTFRLFSFFMDFTAVSVVSFGVAAFAALIIEFPLSKLLRQPHRRSLPSVLDTGVVPPPTTELNDIQNYTSFYGSLTCIRQDSQLTPT